jgi:hypothetical protein
MKNLSLWIGTKRVDYSRGKNFQKVTAHKNLSFEVMYRYFLEHIQAGIGLILRRRYFFHFLIGINYKSDFGFTFWTLG